MLELSPSQRRALRARAHALDPVVIIGGAGLTPGVLSEIERTLSAHELIKIRVADADRGDRQDMLEALCLETGAVPVQHIGKILVVFRERPPDVEAGEFRSKAAAPRRKTAKRAAKRATKRPHHRPGRKT